MIENLNGIHETVNFKENTNIRLYNNDVYEHYPPHWHTPIEIIMPLENDYSVTCSGHPFHVRENDILIICPGVIHALTAPEKGMRIIFQAEFSTLTQIKELESVITIISPATMITPEDYPCIHEKLKVLILDMREDYLENTPLVDASIYSKLLQMFVIIGSNHANFMPAFDTCDYAKQKEFTEKFMFICNYMNEHCTEDLSLDEIAELAGFSKYHFSRLFKKFTGVSFYKYLNQKRIATAERLLIDPQLSVTDVALRSGFASLSTFIRMFHIIKNCTPKEFRNMYTHN